MRLRFVGNASNFCSNATLPTFAGAEQSAMPKFAFSGGTCRVADSKIWLARAAEMSQYETES